ncbi:hypothetical protein IFR05_007876 [Cadophora sp. M221]|nr:hypothetical protein IFR05_007876 [Cadophora sp. M221]
MPSFELEDVDHSRCLDDPRNALVDIRTGWRMVILTASISGLQIIWSTIMSNGTPFLLSLGFSKSATAIVWNIAPICGTFIQPYFGMISDRSENSFGRRKPLMLGGATAISISLFGFASSESIGNAFPGLLSGHASAPTAQSFVKVVAVLYISGIYQRSISTVGVDERTENTVLAEGLRIGSLTGLLLACLAFTANCALPTIIKTLRLTSKSSKGLLRSRYNTSDEISDVALVYVWMFAHAYFAIAMFLTFLVTSQTGNMVLIASVGIPWAITLWVPYSLIGALLSKQHHSFQDGPETGAVMGLHNAAISAPQILSALFSSVVFVGFGGADVGVVWTLRIGGCWAVVAAACSWKLINDWKSLMVDNSIYKNIDGVCEEDSNTLRRRRLLVILPWALHLFVFLRYIIIYILANLDASRNTGPPTGIVSITEDENSRLPSKTASDIFKEREYVVELNIFHQLYCLHGLRKYLYNPRHLEWENDELVTFWEFHMNHCIENLRETLMCNADITPQRFDGDETSQNYMLDRHQQFPNCKNWADIWSWAEDRNTTVDTPTDIGELEKPGQ